MSSPAVDSDFRFAYDFIPTLQVSYKNSKIKQYFKEGRALRTETVINNTRDFRIGKRLINLPALREIGFTANRRLLDVQKISQDCMLGEERLEQLTKPVEIDGQRGSALKLADPRVMALLNALCLFSVWGRGFSNRDMRSSVALLLGHDRETYTRGKMTYDLRRLKLHGFIVRGAHSFRWTVTDEGIRMSLFISKLYARLLRPGLSPCNNTELVGLDRKRAALIRQIDHTIEGLIQEAKMAA